MRGTRAGRKRAARHLEARMLGPVAVQGQKLFHRVRRHLASPHSSGQRAAHLVVLHHRPVNTRTNTLFSPRCDVYSGLRGACARCAASSSVVCSEHSCGVQPQAATRFRSNSTRARENSKPSTDLETEKTRHSGRWERVGKWHATSGNGTGWGIGCSTSSCAGLAFRASTCTSSWSRRATEPARDPNAILRDPDINDCVEEASKSGKEYQQQ
eukprot:1782276-Rhodomonas_salina.1